jgi:RNA polymerase sigma-70 factor (ECF subfamily)
MDRASLQKLVLAEVEPVHRLAYHLCRDRHEAEDLVQETYLRALRSADSFRPGDYGVRPWLFKILHNVLHTRRARDRREREVLRRQSERQPMEENAPAASYPTNDVHAAGATVGQLDWDAMDERLYRAIRLLPLAHRTVFLLAAVEDLKYREISEIVDAPVGTVMSRLSRARAALASQLDELAAEKNLRHRGPATERPKAPAGPKN